MNLCILSHEFPEMAIYGIAEFQVIFFKLKRKYNIIKIV